MRNFTIVIAALTLVLFVLGYFLFSTSLAEYYTLALPMALLIVSGVTLGVHFFFMQAVKQQKQRHFNSIFMSVTAGKLMFYLAGILIYVMFWPKTAKVFLIVFLLLYLLYTVVELVSIMMYMRQKSTNKH